MSKQPPKRQWNSEYDELPSAKRHATESEEEEEELDTSVIDQCLENWEREVNRPDLLRTALNVNGFNIDNYINDPAPGTSTGGYTFPTVEHTPYEQYTTLPVYFTERYEDISDDEVDNTVP